MSVSLNKIVDVSVQVTNPSTIATNFNLGCIIGASEALKNSRVKVYSRENYQTQMVSDGFQTTSNEYKAAVLYFSQSSRPTQLVVGYWNSTESEKPADAYTACRAANGAFYNFCFVDTIEDTAAVEIAGLVEASDIPTVFWVNSNNANCLQASTENTFKKLLDESYTRTFGMYSQNVLVCAAVIGLLSGLNTLEANSAYTAAYKTLTGIMPENISDEQLANLLTYNGNIYCTFGSMYMLTYPMISAGKYHVDDLLLVDAAKYYIQQYAVAGMVALKKVPQTEEGVGNIVSFINNACNKLLDAGLIAGGIWKGDTILDLESGDAIPNGFLVQAGTVASQTAEERASRVSPPIYVALLSSGSIEHVVISVFVNR